MKFLGKAYKWGSLLIKSLTFSVFKVSFCISCTAYVFTWNTLRLLLIQKVAIVLYQKIPPIIIELH
jgi:hypothetical protein